MVKDTTEECSHDINTQLTGAIRRITASMMLVNMGGGTPSNGFVNILPTYNSDILTLRLNRPCITVCMRRLRPSKYAECDDESSDLALRKRSSIFPLKSDDSNSNGTPNGIGLSLFVLLLTVVPLPALTNTGACSHFSGCRLGKVECDKLELNDVMM